MIIPSPTPKPENPALIEKLVGAVQDQLINYFPWLTYAFGKAQKLVSLREGTPFVYPAIHISNGQYVSVLPDQDLGNFSFFTLEDPWTIPKFSPHEFNIVRIPYGLVLWVNLDDVFNDHPDRNLELLKEDLIKFLTRKIVLKYGSLTIDKIYEKAENVYKGYSLKEVDTQYLMHPYAGIRIEGEFIYIEGSC